MSGQVEGLDRNTRLFGMEFWCHLAAEARLCCRGKCVVGLQLTYCVDLAAPKKSRQASVVFRNV